MKAKGDHSAIETSKETSTVTSTKTSTGSFAETLRAWLVWFEGFSSRWWYSSLLCFLAAIDVFVLVVPSDGILASSALLQPRKWWQFALALAVGSSLGGAALVYLVQLWGMPWVVSYFPAMVDNSSWQWFSDFVQAWGLLFVFLVAATPIIQHPTLTISALVENRFGLLIAVFFAGRLVKSLIIAGVAAKAPSYLKRLWGISGELKEAGYDDSVLKRE